MSSLSERLQKDIYKKEINRIKRAEDIYDEDEETMDYLNRQREGFINENKSCFTGFGDEGLNNALSVFDKQAIFKTGSK